MRSVSRHFKISWMLTFEFHIFVTFHPVFFLCVFLAFWQYQTHKPSWDRQRPRLGPGGMACCAVGWTVAVPAGQWLAVGFSSELSQTRKCSHCFLQPRCRRSLSQLTWSCVSWSGWLGAGWLLGRVTGWSRAVGKFPVAGLPRCPALNCDNRTSLIIVDLQNWYL